MFLKLIARVIVILSSNTNPVQIAAGLASGLFLALLPAGNLLWVLLFLILFVSKAHYGIALAALAVFKLVASLAAGPLDALGWAVLNASALRPAFTALYGMPIAPLTRFNNTLVMGGLLAGLVLWAPAFLTARAGVTVYRARLAPRIAGSKFVAALKKVPLVSALAKALGAAARIAGPAE